MGTYIYYFKVLFILFTVAFSYNLLFCLSLPGSVCIVIISTFYLNSFRRDWMPMPERNTFGYSYWLEFATTCLLMASFLMTLIAGVLKILDISEEKETAFSEDMMLGRR